MYYRFFILVVLLVTFSFSHANSPSFNCSKASKTVEDTICNNLFLSDLDNHVARLYKYVINNSSNDSKAAIKYEQIDWIKNRNRCSYDYQGNLNETDCIKAMYRKRINELKQIKSLPETYSHKLYREGNTYYRNGKYYNAIKNYHNAYDYANDYVEKIRIIGALAQISKEEGNISLSKKYARRILDIDPTSQFAKDIISLPNAAYLNRNPKTSTDYSASPSSQRELKCAVLVFGPDLCGSYFRKFAKENLNKEVNDLLLSPTCAASIATILDEGFSDSDMAIAVTTGALDSLGQAGFESDNAFKNILGILSYGASLSIKFSSYDQCLRK